MTRAAVSLVAVGGVVIAVVLGLFLETTISLVLDPSAPAVTHGHQRGN